MRHLGCTLLAACALTGLQAQSEPPAYVRLTAVAPMGDLRAYLGDRPLATALELGWDFHRPDAVTGIGVHATVLQAKGRDIPRYGGLTQDLKAFRLGADMRMRTPVAGLLARIGLGMAFYNGTRATTGTVPNLDDPTKPWIMPPGTYKEKKGKFGGRVGAEYQINDRWGLALDYNFSEWTSDSRIADYTPVSGNRHVDGVNPVNPSWVGLSVQYRFHAWK